jgi:DNA primase
VKRKPKNPVNTGYFVGLMGIHSIAYNGKLPYEFQLLIKTCQIQEVIFLLDADFDQLRNNIAINEQAEQRPYSFFKAVTNFRDYFKTFTNVNIYLELYFGHIIPNENNDKGIDDLLTNSLAEKENDLYQDIDFAINNKESSFSGNFVQLFKITTAAESKIQEYFSINGIEAFTRRHLETLKNLPEFRFSKYKWKIVDNVAQLSQPLMDDEIFWEEITWYDSKGKEHRDFKFDYKNTYNFLKNRGFSRIMMADNKFLFCHIVNKIIHIVEPYQIRDYVTQLTEEIAPKDILNMLYRGGKQYLGPESLSHLKFTLPVFDIPEKGSQCLYFSDVFWKINANSMEEFSTTELQYNIWSDKIRSSKVNLIKEELIEIKQIDEDFLNKLSPDKRIDFAGKIGQFGIELSPAAKKSHFIQFLINTSDFYWQKYKDVHSRQPLNKDSRCLDEILETNLHFISKITAIGYLLHKYRDRSCEKAVIGMDGKNSEVGESNGRTGKSLLGYAIGKMIPQVYIPGKDQKLTEDQFIFEQVTEKTDNIFIDDTRANFDFEFLFPIITGTITVNSKGQKKFNLPPNSVPKIYLTTNHAINGRSGSFRDRQAFICFSDYYSDFYKPIHDFGINFFDEWEADQWNLFYNFMAFCLKTYFKLGIVAPPMEIVEKRRLRQYIGDDFICWANDYYGTTDDDSPDVIYGENINVQIPRGEIYNNFFEKCPSQRKWVTSKNFKNKLKAWCEYRELVFNPHPDKNKCGKDNKSGGVEYITVGNLQFR